MADNPVTADLQQVASVEAEQTGASTVTTPVVGTNSTPRRTNSRTAGFAVPADNIASMLRRRCAVGGIGGNDHKDRTTFGTKTPTKNFPVKTPSARSAETGTCPFAAPIRKAGSVQDVPAKSSGTPTKMSDLSPLKRAQSVQNMSRGMSGMTEVKPSGTVRRTSSSQHVAQQCASSTSRHSAPVSASMAYNAELLASFERERRALESRISELIQLAESRRTEVEMLKIKVRELQRSEEHTLTAEEVELVRHENQMMRDRLAEHNITIEHFTDAEKLSMLQVRNSDDQDGAVGGLDTIKGRSASDGGESCRENEGLDIGMSSSLDANWDRASEGALTVGSTTGSEISVACLQDRLQMMEETQYCTSEELAATTQELIDLQRSVHSLTAENEQLADERMILLESLCAQTEKLENARRQVQHLKAILLRDGDGCERSEKERELAALVRAAGEEREELLLKQTELHNKLQLLQGEKHELHTTAKSFREQLAAVSLEKRSLQAQIKDLTEKAAHDAADLRKFQALHGVDMADAEIQQQLTSEVSVNNDCAHCGQLKTLLSEVRNELAAVTAECSQLHGQLKTLGDELQECRECRDAAQEHSSEMEYRIRAAERELEEARSSADAVCASSARLIEEQRVTVTRLESELRMARMHADNAERAITEMSARFEEERKEWECFQRDLQTAVVVAVDVRNEAQEDADRLVNENRSLREREAALRRELDAVLAETVRLRTAQRISDVDPSMPSSSMDIRDCVLSTVDRELSMLRQHGRRGSELNLSPSVTSTTQPSLSVRRLISSIEEQVKSSESLGNRNAPTQFEASSRPPMFRHYSTAFESEVEKPVLRRTSSQSITSGNEFTSKLVSGKRLNGDGSSLVETDEAKSAVSEACSLVSSSINSENKENNEGSKKPLAGILSNKSTRRKSSIGETDYPLVVGHLAKMADPLGPLAKQLGGSKRNALLKWCQNRTATYTGIDITNFSSSWNDGLAFCALLHTYLPDRIPYKELNSNDKMRNFTLAFKAAESVGISTSLNLNEMLATERPDWQAVMTYVTEIYKHFEVDTKI